MAIVRVHVQTTKWPEAPNNPNPLPTKPRSRQGYCVPQAACDRVRDARTPGRKREVRFPSFRRSPSRTESIGKDAVVVAPACPFFFFFAR